MTRHATLTHLLLCALFAALTAVCSAISIPLPFTPIPVNLATLSVFLAGGLLGWKYGTISQMIYVLMGAVGIPVFHSFTGGLGVLAGPTGGYIFGYITAAFLTGLIIHFFKKETSIPVLAIAMSFGMLSCYLLGTIWFMVSTGAGLAAALLVCAAPFLLGDGLKIVIGCMLVKKLRPLLIKTKI